MTTPRAQLAKVVKDHRCNREHVSRHGCWIYVCVCGATLSSNSHDAQAAHIADAIIAAGWTPPPPATLDPATEN